jgi:ribosomal protein S12 methylthiotransferase accessory factor
VRLRGSVPKVGGGAANRELPTEETWARVAPHLRRVGVTRVADVTGLDRVGLPVYAAICPRSPDGLSVYGGKGQRPVDARTSAVMEAIERFAACLPRRPDEVASYRELVDAGRAVVEPGSHSAMLSRDYRDDAPISWVAGYDLISDETVLVPHGAVAYAGAPHEAPCYEVTTSNGLAAGNSLEEAICHALCELVERDSITVSELVSSHLGDVLEEGRSAPRPAEGVVAGLRSLHPHFDLGSLPARAGALVERFHAAGVQVRMVDLTTDLGIPSVLCTTLDDFGPGRGRQGYAGFGAHPDVEVAMVRALAECAQSRAVDVQGVREDLSEPEEEVAGFRRHVQRSRAYDTATWAWQPTATLATAADVPGQANDDVMADLRFVLDRLRDGGIRRAIAVDLSPPSVPVAVVRVLAPGLESWSLDHSRIGWRAAAAWNRAVEQVTAGRFRLSTAPAR